MNTTLGSTATSIQPLLSLWASCWVLYLHVSSNLSNNSVREILLWCPVYRSENWGTERPVNLPNFPQLISARTRIHCLGSLASTSSQGNTGKRLRRGVDFKTSNVHYHSCLFPSKKSKNQSKVFQPRFLVPLKVNLKFPCTWRILTLLVLYVF